MGHEAIIYGVIIGVSCEPGVEYHKYQRRNEDIIRSLDRDTDWPWIDMSIFAIPGPYPVGTYRRQAIHFGFSIKEDTTDNSQWLEILLSKFEMVLKKLYWSSARMHIERDFAPIRSEYYWIPTEQALNHMYSDMDAVQSWQREYQILPGEKFRGT